jgi:L-lactate dehydrogenase complex protein LldG
METSKARSAILQRIRQAQQRDESQKSAEVAMAQAYLRQPEVGPLPSLGGCATGEASALVDYFCQQALKMSDTLTRLASLSEVPQEVQRYLQEQQLPLAAHIWPEFAELPWASANIAVQIAPAPVAERMQQAVGVTSAFCAVAETGSLLLTSSAQTPVSTAMLPETHIAILQESRIVAYMEQAFTLLQQEQGLLPRTATFISGPSRTGDIEQTIVLGAHGPYRVHVILIKS